MATVCAVCICIFYCQVRIALNTIIVSTITSTLCSALHLCLLARAYINLSMYQCFSVSACPSVYLVYASVYFCRRKNRSVLTLLILILISAQILIFIFRDHQDLQVIRVTVK